MQALGALWALLVTQRPTCQIAALYTHWCRMRKGLTSTALSQRKPLPNPDISPSQTSHLVQPVIPNGGNPLHGTGANSNPTKVRPGAVLGDPNRVRGIVLVWPRISSSGGFLR